MNKPMPQDQTDPTPEDGEADDVAALFSYDPFGEQEQEPEEAAESHSGGEPEPAAGEPNPSESEDQTPRSPETPDAQQQAPKEDPRDKEIREMRDLLNQMQGRLEAQQAPKQQEPQGAEAPEDPLPDYTFQIPDQLMNALDSEDPGIRRQGLQALMKGLATSVHQQVRGEFGQRLEQFQTQVPQQTQQMLQQREEVDKVRSDFYGTYTSLDDPHFYPLVQRVGQQVMQEKGTKKWTPELRDEIGRRVYALLKWAPPERTQAPSATPASPTPPRNAPPRQVPTGTRPSQGRQGTPGPNDPEYILDVLKD